MNLDELARSASEELRSRTTTNADAMLADLRRIRTRRSLIRSAALVAAFALVVGGVALARADHGAVAPTDDGSDVTNGALVVSDVGTVSVIDGSLATVPADAASYSPLAFTPDGSELIYVRRGEDLVAMSVTSGQTRTLAHCPDQLCWVALSPDGTRLAVPAEVGGKPGLELRQLGTGESQFLPTGHGAAPEQWSPDGSSLVYTTSSGLYTIAADGTGQPRLLHEYLEKGLGGATAVWSPNGDAVTFLEVTRAETPPHTGGAVLDYTAMIVQADGTGLRTLHDAGRCYCLGIPRPTLAWSPDGTLIAISTIDSGPPGDPGAATSDGVHTIHPDGTGWSREVISTRAGSSMAWQPLPH